MTILLMERQELPLVSFVWLMRSGGSIHDPLDAEGTAWCTAAMLRKGTVYRKPEEISEALDFMGASYNARASHDYSTGSAEFLRKDIAQGVDLVADMLRNPRFPEAELQKLVKQEMDGILEAKEVPNQVIGRYFRSFLFKGHPYARPVTGTEASLPRITQARVSGFHAQNYVPNECILAVVGDFKPQEMHELLRARFSDWQPKPRDSEPMKSLERTRGRRVLLVEKPDSTQTFFWLGSLGVERTHPEWVPLQVVNTLFGGRFTSMINTALRIESGLTYGARSGFSENTLRGEFFLGSFTKNETTGKALELMTQVLENLQKNGVTEQQLQSAKSYIKGQFGPTLETNDQLAETISELEFYGMGAEYINDLFRNIDRVTPEVAKQVIREHYPLDHFVLVMIGQPGVIGPVAARISTGIERKLITDPGF